MIKLDALDATERKALTLTTFTSACICFAPAELISGVLLLLVSVALFRWDRAVTLREAAVAPVLAEASISPDAVRPDAVESRPTVD